MCEEIDIGSDRERGGGQDSIRRHQGKWHQKYVRENLPRRCWRTWRVPGTERRARVRLTGAVVVCDAWRHWGVWSAEAAACHQTPSRTAASGTPWCARGLGNGGMHSYELARYGRCTIPQNHHDSGGDLQSGKRGTALLRRSDYGGSSAGDGFENKRSKQ